MKIHEGYPRKIKEIIGKNYVYSKKGDKLNYFCISGAEDRYFEA